MRIDFEIVDDDGTSKKLFKSPNNRKIRKIGTNEVYDSALDLITSTFEYEETDVLIEQEVSELENKGD